MTTLVAAMAYSTMQLYAVAVLASDLRDDLDISRTQIGVAGAVATGLGALSAPYLGRRIDTIGAKRGAMTVLGAGGVSLILTALAPHFGLLLVASAVGGIALSGGNAATNKLIGLHVPDGHRGTVTGIKQSGVTLSLFLCGLTLPTLSDSLGWRWAISLYGIVALVATALVAFRLEPDPESGQSPAHRSRSRAPLASWVRRLAIYGFLMGVTTAGIIRFLPLFAEEELGLSEAEAGLAMALVGLAGIAARIIAGRLAEHNVTTRASLFSMAVIAAVVAVLLMVSPNVGSWLVWPIALLTATSSIAWNAVGNLAIIRGVDPDSSGKATGLLLLGFLAGLTVGAPMTGAIVDQTGSYSFAWAVVLATAGLAALVTATGDEPPVLGTRAPISS
ncbi:MAG: MFS transporter [Acidimicrobiales bacterium]